MLLFITIGLGLVAWPLLSYTYPHLFSRVPFCTSHACLHKGSIVTPQLSRFIEETLALEHITGLSVAVVSKHAETEFHTWGYRTEDGDEVTPDTLFHMASVSKAFCAAALGLLIDDFTNGSNVTALPSPLTELTWHTRLRDLLPDWQLMDEWASERANLRDILSHLSGLPGHDYSYGLSDTPQELIARLKYLRPTFELREQWLYNNIMYMVAAHVIATYSGQSYTSFVEERIFAPLRMTSSTFSPTRADASGKFTQGWSKDGRRMPVHLTEDTAFLIAGPGGVISNAVDMAKWISMWIGEGVYDNRTVIPSSVYRNVTYSYSVSADHPIDPKDSIVGYGLGWFRGSYRGHDVVFHSGSLPGFTTIASFLPRDEIGVTIFANSESKAGPMMLISNRILDSALHPTSSLTPASLPRCNVTTTTPNAQGSTSSLDAFAGTYANPAYGSFTLCSPSSASSYCVKVQSDFSVVDTVQGNPSASEELLAEWTRMWSSHVRMRHQQGSIFQMYFPTLYQNGYGKNATPFETSLMDTAGLAEFVVKDSQVVGFGLSGLVGRLTERARKYETVQDRAEVWFDKVSQ